MAIDTISLFQSTPVIANGRIRNGAGQRKSLIRFQSTPVIANGRIVKRQCRTYPVRGFNPRPLLLTGESGGEHVFTVDLVDVSIHARYC